MFNIIYDFLKNISIKQNRLRKENIKFNFKTLSKKYTYFS